MNEQQVNSHIRIIKIAADVLNSKPTDWNPEGLDGDCVQQFCTVFRTLYEEGQMENNCLPVVLHYDGRRGVGYLDESLEIDRVLIGIDNTTAFLTATVTLSGQVVQHWASKT